MKGKVKQVLKKLLGEVMLGMLDYYRFPSWRAPGKAFNDQRVRQQIFVEMLNHSHPEALVETGTFHGTTTEFMASITPIPLFSVEYANRNYVFAKIRLRRFSNIELHCGDSRDYLRELMRTRRLPSGRIFFYLDAHWGEDLPLADEIELIFSSRPNAIVMIDDFQVPWDQGYGYDDYGPNKALVQEYIAPLVERYQLAQFYPSVPSIQETGSKRGCVVLAKDTAIIGFLREIPLLREYPA
jgi:predicted O-methyltransferase YrrM